MISDVKLKLITYLLNKVTYNTINIRDIIENIIQNL